MIEKEGSVRIDLVGGTLDIFPINLILRNAITLNFATDIKSKVQIEEAEIDGVEIISNDLEIQRIFEFSEFNNDNYYSDHFGPLLFLARIIGRFKFNQGLKISLSSGSPPGAGLGGSSTLGLTLFRALCEFTHSFCDDEASIEIVKDIEASILDSGMTGYQDYYPAAKGGILALKPGFGKVHVEQLYSPELKKFIEEHITLIYSGKTRHSGINNWEVYKEFFDKKVSIREGLNTIAKISHEAYEMIKSRNFSKLNYLISLEGEERKKLFPGIVTDEIAEFFHELKAKIPHLGMKVCGAGGGGCFILLHQPSDRDYLEALMKDINRGFRIMDFKVERNIFD